MNTIKIKSYAKINLTLEITGVERGYHLLDSLVSSVDLFDYLTLKKRKEKTSVIHMRGLGSESIPPEKNNALRAAESFSERFSTLGVEVTIDKNIPIGAGLGGSSADVVGVILGMAKLYGVKDKLALKEFADSLGSDTGYMLSGGFARMQGRGEKVTPLALKNKLHFLLLCPREGVSAKECYKKYDALPKTLEWKENPSDACLAALQRNDLNEAGRYLMNDLFVAATHLNSEVEQAKKEGEAFSPLGVTMTGSGSGILALFENKELCEWAKSRYKGNFETYVISTITPNYEKIKTKERMTFRNPFALSQEEIMETEE